MSYPLPDAPADSFVTNPSFKEVEATLAKFSQGLRPSWEKSWQWEMAHAHVFLLDMTKRAYLYAQYAVDHDDLANYLAFSEIAIYQIWNHHKFEEDDIYPAMLKHSPAPMLERNIKEHHAFSHAMDATWLYLRKCRALLQPTPRPSPIPEPPADVNEIDLGQFGLDPAAGFNPQALRKHMDSWMLALAKHLADEIDTLTPEYIISVGKDNITQINKDVVKHLQSYDPTWFLCSTYSSVPVEVANELLQLPWFVRKLLIPFVFGPKYAGCWKYCAHPENLSFWS